MATAARPILAQPKPEVVQTPASYGVKIVPFRGPTPYVDSPLVYEPQSQHRPKQVLLGSLADPGFRVVKPIQVYLESREDAVVASWREIDEFGTGTSTSSAAEELGRTVAELYRSLQSDRDKLGPDLQRIWVKLQEHVVPRR